jgi:hypothetical protein
MCRTPDERGLPSVVTGECEHVVRSAQGLPAGLFRKNRWRLAQPGTDAVRQQREVADVGSGYRIESDLALSSDWLPPDAFSRIYEDCAVAVAMAIEGVDDPAIQEARVVDVAMGTVVWRSTEDEYE